MKTNYRSGRSQKGIILIVTLLLLVFVLAIVGGLFFRHQINLQKVGKTLTSEQGILLLLSAETWAQSLLDRDARESNVDYMGESWAQQLPALPIEGGIVTGCLIDYQGQFNINDLAWYTNKSWEDEIEGELTGSTATTRRTIFKQLLKLLGLNNSDTRVAAVVDWVDSDTWLVSPESAEDNEYLLLKPAYRPANFLIGDISELSLVMGFTEDDVYRLQNQVSTAPEQTAINVNTATSVTLQALFEDITSSQLRDFTERRPFNNLAEFYEALSEVLGQPVSALQQAIPPQLLTVSSNYFLLQAVIELGAVKLAYQSLLQRKPGNATQVYARTVRYLPRILDKDQELSHELAGCRLQELLKS